MKQEMVERIYLLVVLAIIGCLVWAVGYSFNKSETPIGFNEKLSDCLEEAEIRWVTYEYEQAGQRLGLTYSQSLDSPEKHRAYLAEIEKVKAERKALQEERNNTCREVYGNLEAKVQE